MAGYKGADLNDRMSAAANAKKALLEKFKAKPGADDPTVIARQEARRAILEAREQRQAERELARQAELVRQAELEVIRLAEEAERERERQAQIAEEARLEAQRVQAEKELEVQRKAARDARYAARKARR
jgi:hypothetical protein